MFTRLQLWWLSTSVRRAVIWAGIKRYFWNLCLLQSQALKTICGGDPRETMPSRLGKAQRKGSDYGEELRTALDTLIPDHCKDSIDDNVGYKEVKWK